MKMTFGKHKGTELNQIPVSYLRWVLDEASGQATPDLIRAIREQLESVRPPLVVDPVADESLADEEEEPILEDIPPEEAGKNMGLLLADLQKAREDLKQVEAERAGLQDRINQFADYFDKWYRVVHPLLHLDRNHAAESYFNQLKKEVEKWKQG